MPIQKVKQNFNGVAYTLQQPSGAITSFEVDQNTAYSWTKTGRKGELFNIGGGNQLITKNYESSGEFWLDYGSHVLRAQNDFTAWVHMWGAGGGGQHHEGNTNGGGGGFSQALVRFKAGVPYTIVVGQAGDNGNDTTHGGGGRGHDGGGQGGGLSGIFMGSTHFGKARWGHGTPPVTQSQGLMVAGGGGGKGHHSQSHHGSGGGGGGWSGRGGHNSGAGHQTYGGHGGYNNDGVDAGRGKALHGGHSYSNSWQGGGGGGWWGGGGGGHTSNHHNGGGGGSGHIAYPSSVGSQPNNDKAEYIITGHTEFALADHGTQFPAPANPFSPLAKGDGTNLVGQGGSGFRTGHGQGHSPSHGKVVITLANEKLNNPQLQFPTHGSPQDTSGHASTY
jgi:hypothetical protein